MSDKILQDHLDRDAYVYVRQSTMHQVRFNHGGRDRQYALAQRARELGFGGVKVIDEDLGRSGSGSEERPGFAKLVASVCAAEVGAVLALEASRLARNNRDWHHLIDLCAMTGTLVIDLDGVYDPRRLNDRLLLGLKGTMGEFELNLLHQRAQESLLQMVEQGEVLFQPPVYNRVHSILTNPCYTGAFAYGRRETRTTVVDGRARKTSGHAVPRDQWPVLIHDHHEGYIDWETYVGNRKQIHSNRGWGGRMRQNPQVEIAFDRQGRVGSVKILRATGYQRFDELYLESWMSRWRAEDPRLVQLEPGQLTNPIRFNIVFFEEKPKR